MQEQQRFLDVSTSQLKYCMFHLHLLTYITYCFKKCDALFGVTYTADHYVNIMFSDSPREGDSQAASEGRRRHPTHGTNIAQHIDDGGVDKWVRTSQPRDWTGGEKHQDRTCKSNKCLTIKYV